MSVACTLRSMSGNDLIFKVCFSLYLIFISPICVNAERAQSNEYQLKAAFLHKFLGFIDWETSASSAESEKEICILGKNPFGDSLQRLAELHNGFDVVIRKVDINSDFNGCNLLFISKSEEAELVEVLSKLKNSSVVTVSDIPGFASQGGVIELILEDGKYVRFIINPSDTKEKGIRLDSQLLALAKSILGS